MITISLPTNDGVIALIGFTPDELRQVANGVGVVDTVDFRLHFAAGVPLPNMVQIVMVEKNEDLVERIERMFPGASKDIITLKSPPERPE